MAMKAQEQWSNKLYNGKHLNQLSKGHLIVIIFYTHKLYTRTNVEIFVMARYTSIIYMVQEEQEQATVDVAIVTCKESWSIQDINEQIVKENYHST